MDDNLNLETMTNAIIAAICCYDRSPYGILKNPEKEEGLFLMVGMNFYEKNNPLEVENVRFQRPILSFEFKNCVKKGAFSDFIDKKSVQMFKSGIAQKNFAYIILSKFKDDGLSQIIKALCKQLVKT